MRELRWLALAAALAATAWPALRAGDEAVARQAWDAGQRAASSDPAARVWVDVAWFQQRVAPWQPGYAESQARLRDVGARRRSILRDDRGARRRTPEGE